MRLTPRHGRASNELPEFMAEWSSWLSFEGSCSIGNDHARKLAGHPDVNGSAEVDGLIKGARFDVQGCWITGALMPKTRSAV